MVTAEIERLEFEEASRLVLDAQTIAIVTHLKPDGDAIGSLLGLGQALKAQGKIVSMLVDDGVPDYLSFVEGAEDILTEPHAIEADLIIAVDCADAERAGNWGALLFNLGKPIIVLDHHPTNTFFGQAHIVKSAYVSTTEAVLMWLDYLGWELTREIAHPLLVGLVTDTMGFRVGAVTATTFEIAGRLVALGLDLREIVERTLINMPARYMKAMGRGLEKATLENHVIWSGFTLEDQTELDLLDGSKPELSSEMLRNDEAYISAFFTETEEGDVRVSFRSVPGFNVAAVAQTFGGGGHIQAAGCTIEKSTLHDAMAQVIPLLKAEAQRGTPQY